MHFMDGFLKGLPQILNNTSYDFLKGQDVYFIRVRIMKLNTHLGFPLTSKVNDDGVRDFITDMDNETIYVDKAGREYLITLHESM